MITAKETSSEVMSRAAHGCDSNGEGSTIPDVLISLRLVVKMQSRTLVGS